MEATERTQSNKSAPREKSQHPDREGGVLEEINATCSECLQPASNTVADASGATVCAECAALYYLACAGCQGLIPQDEARERDGSSYCAGCFHKAVETPGVTPPDEEELEALVIEYVSLHSEHKKISDRLDEIKERLKAAAALKQRIGGAVVLRAGEAVIRCSYTLKYKCDAEKVEALADALGQERFASLFERKVSFNPVKDNLEEFLTGASDAMREAVLDAIEKTEVPMLIVPRRKKQARSALPSEIEG